MEQEGLSDIELIDPGRLVGRIRLEGFLGVFRALVLWVLRFLFVDCTLRGPMMQWRQTLNNVGILHVMRQ